MRCPLCGGTDLASTVARDRVPVLQNRVYDSRAEALAAPAGRFELVQCRSCGFAHNAAFDPSLAVYDEHYDNQVPSAVMEAHYEAIARQLVSKYRADSGLLIDVGCGKGAFLEVACRLFPSLRAMGIDPSYDGPEHRFDGRLRFVRQPFRQEHVRQQPSLLVCRHVVEHMPRPVQFLSTVHAALRQYPFTPVFVEVPDLRWIVQNDAFWDFCYEHCNYFTAPSLRRALAAAGFDGPATQGTAYGGQYLWTEHVPVTEGPPVAAPDEKPPDLSSYAEREARMLDDVTGRIDALRDQGSRIVVWGMATKGVMFANAIDPFRLRFAHCVDINVNKQGKYTPLSGHRIESPLSLTFRADQPYTVIVMNPLYAGEVMRACGSMGLQVNLVDALGTPLD